MVLVAILTLRQAYRSQFHTSERQVATSMRTHGGQIKPTITHPVDSAPQPFKERHILRFTSQAAFTAYRQDRRLTARQTLRDAAIVATDLLIGANGPDYHAPLAEAGL